MKSLNMALRGAFFIACVLWAALPAQANQLDNSYLVSRASSATPITILPLNPSRQQYSIFNESTSVMYVMESNSGTVSASNYSFQVAPGAYYVTTNWVGSVTALWATANGNARVTEYAP